MDIRKQLENHEEQWLHPLAALSQDATTEYPEEACPLRTKFQRDRDRIIHSKSFRRLKDKTQVFIAPEGDHYRTRLTHTLEVSQIARTIARGLRLNEDLAEAIALGHDLGHTPFGHAGEDMLNKALPQGFKHNEQSWRIVKYLERTDNENYKGLNLSEEVVDGILNHTGETLPFTAEGQIVKIADRIAYINHDIDDAIRGGIIRKEGIPEEFTKILGDTTSERINTIVSDMIDTSNKRMDKLKENGAGRPKTDVREEMICISPEVEKAMLGLRQFMFDTVYIDSPAKSMDKEAQNTVGNLYKFFTKFFRETAEENPEKLSPDQLEIIKKQGAERAAADFISGCTDSYIITLEKEIYRKTWNFKDEAKIKGGTETYGFIR